ncbi:queuosine precursor transporter [Bacillus alveayuensis]|jgi:queuosine precursor transporter|uniref:queuosine precursor transporter n=1 Tax=Aeribacillus alveayuensis TaxID=279215 RepID=UPI0005D11BE0|nr:queuosine precursor transporter [Bacillus alveayuensis]
MFNEWLGFASAMLTFSLVLIIYRLFGRTGLFVWIAFSTVVANIQVVKTVELLGLTATLGNVMYGSAFLVTDILSEKYGKKEAQKAVWLGFFTLISLTIVMQLALLYQPHELDYAQQSLETIFGLLPRIAAGSLLAFIISQSLDVYLFHFIKNRFPKNSQLWIRNNISTMISQLVDTLIFTSVAFLGVFSMNEWWQIFFTTYILKWLVAVFDTPFVYIAKQFPKRER